MPRPSFVDAVAAYFSEVVALFGRRRGWLSPRVPKHRREPLHCAAVGIYIVWPPSQSWMYLSESVEYDGVVAGRSILFVEQDGLRAGVDDILYHLVFQHRLALYNYFSTLNRADFAGIFVDEILYPLLYDAGSQLTADCF